MSEHRLVKIRFALEPGAWHGSATETLWAMPLGQGRYELRSVPFYVFDVSYEDVVEVADADGVLTFVRVISHSGHSTYRILINDANRTKLDTFWAPIAARGCTYEAGTPPLRTIDVPPSANLHSVYELLEKGEAAEVWSFEEGHVGHRLN